MKFKLLGGGQIEAATDLGLVEALREDAARWAPTVSIEDFMEEYSGRCKIQKGVTVRIDSVLNFILDLQLFGFLEPAFEPWHALGADGIKMGLFTSTLNGRWGHLLLWSFEKPLLVSTLINDPERTGPVVGRHIDVASLSKPGYQRDWLIEHRRELSRH